MVVIPIINNGSVTKTCRYLFAGECPTRSTATTRSRIKQVLSILSPSPKTSIVSFHN